MNLDRFREFFACLPRINAWMADQFDTRPVATWAVVVTACLVLVAI